MQKYGRKPKALPRQLVQWPFTKEMEITNVTSQVWPNMVFKLSFFPHFEYGKLL